MEDVSSFVRSLLDQMQQRFETMSQNIIEKIDSVGSKVDALDDEITSLMKEAGLKEEEGMEVGMDGKPRNEDDKVLVERTPGVVAEGTEAPGK